MEVGTRLKLAREKSGLTLKQVEERTRIGPSSLSAFENGQREPKLSQLHALADVYRRSMTFFLDEEEHAEHLVLWRQRPEDQQVAAAIEGQFIRLCEQYHNLESWLGEHVACRLPVADGDAGSYSYRDAERLALDVRRDLGLGERPAQVLLTKLEEECSVRVFHRRFDQIDQTGFAACTVDPDFGAAVLLNAAHVRWRRNFDLAHELFHLLTWAVFRQPDSGDGTSASEPEEKFATCFASNLLMPADATNVAVAAAIVDGKIAFSGMFDIARQFDVSVDALIWRMTFLKLLSFDDAPDIIARYHRLAALWEGDRERDEPPLRPARFRALAIKALRRGEISLGRFAEYMDVSRQQARRFVEQDAECDEEVQVASA